MPRQDIPIDHTVLIMIISVILSAKPRFYLINETFGIINAQIRKMEVELDHFHSNVA